MYRAYFSIADSQQAIRNTLSEGLAFGDTQEDILKAIEEAHNEACNACCCATQGNPPCELWGWCRLERTVSNCSRVARERAPKKIKEE